MNKNQQFYLTCDGIKLHCKLDLPEETGAPRSSASAGRDAASGGSAPAGHTDEGATARIPMVIVVPGLSGDMEEQQITATAEALAGNGYASLCVELYGHGLSGGAFYDHTLFHWALELMLVIDYARKLDYVSELYLCGHSQGGAAAVLAAGIKPDALSGLILLAPAMSIKDAAKNGGFPERCFDPDHIPDETKVFTEDRISGNYYRVNRLLPFDDAIALFGSKPVLIVHSTTDEYVPYRYAVRTAGAYRNTELFTVPDDDHCFAAHIDLVTAKMIRFLNGIRR
ncbi:MAG: alpha/beta fold hydrolase [Oscillospiraceae bacterium]|nr:alpha/beta fold hydrolase [Oscillospiraceae bacterium]